MKKVLVTGSSGYIGSVMCKLLKEHDYNVVGVDVVQSPSKYIDLFLYHNIRDPEVAETASDVDAIFHFAASADVGLSVERPALFYHNNVGATTEMMDNMIAAGWRGKMIFSSTAAVYAAPTTNDPIHEDAVKDSPNPYGKSKLMCEQAIWDIARSHNISTTMFRYFNVAGAWDDVGDHLFSGHIIPRICLSQKKNQPFSLYGNDKKTPDKSCIRDYVGVLDICRAHLHALEANKQPIGVFNLGTGRGTSNLELIKGFHRFTGRQVDVIIAPPRAGDPDILVANPKSFVDTTGFIYKHSSLEEMITSSWSYYNQKWSDHGV